MEKKVIQIRHGGELDSAVDYLMEHFNEKTISKAVLSAVSVFEAREKQRENLLRANNDLRNSLNQKSRELNEIKTTFKRFLKLLDK